MVQMTLITVNREEENIASRMRYVRSMLNELVKEVESRAVTKDKLKNRVKSVERALKITREGF